MELLHLAKRSGRSDTCDNVGWSLQAPLSTQQTDNGVGRAAAARAALCRQPPCRATQRAVEATTLPPPPYPPSPSFQQQVAAALDVGIQPGSFLQGPLRTEEKGAASEQKKACSCCAPELETSFIYVDENVNLETCPQKPLPAKTCSLRGEVGRAGLPEWSRDASASLMSEDEDDLGSEAAGKSVDYGFVSAILFLVTGILLVIISYVVPREVAVDPNTVAAREMERLERESARIGAHLDRCVIAGLCLLTLGGVVLSCLLMMSLWKGELYRRSRFAASKESAKLYGSFHFRMKAGPGENTLELSLVEEDALTVQS
ncbi:transmembrane protein 74 [Tachyglossus aculeatus]|uniref:transmembrane protein 74 n=1 Tax=Tachyglossus aculeatus TaxID=9261 RepID=UPI0018F54C4C|nr:transmembrane protein 74 [Tachyglossus aculeatus]